MTKSPRFSKAQVKRQLENICSQFEGEHGFRFDRGYGQVENAQAEVQRAYGRYDLARELLEDWQ